MGGNPVTQVEVGEEFVVRRGLRTTDRNSDGNVAVVDLLPGGVEVVYNQPPPIEPGDEDEYYDDEYESGLVPPVGEPQFSDWSPNFIDLREDRVVMYGTAGADVRTFTYRVRATNAGDFVTPPAFAQSMYQPTVVG